MSVRKFNGCPLIQPQNNGGAFHVASVVLKQLFLRRNRILSEFVQTTRISTGIFGQLQKSGPERGVGGKPKIVAKPDPSVSNSAWVSIFQMNVGLHFTT